MPEAAGFMPKQDVIALILGNKLREEKAGLNTALFIVTSAFHGKKTRDGGDYIKHCLHVGLTSTDSDTKMVIGVMHDLIEDTDWTFDDLRRVGFSERVIAGVCALTHDEESNEPYFDFIRRCSLNEDAIDIKLRDLDHNMRLSRSIAFPNEEQQQKQRAYLVSYQYLLAVKREEIESGSSMTFFMASRPDLNDASLLQQFSNEAPAAAPVPRI